MDFPKIPNFPFKARYVKYTRLILYPRPILGEIYHITGCEIIGIDLYYKVKIEGERKLIRSIRFEIIYDKEILKDILKIN